MSEKPTTAERPVGPLTVYEQQLERELADANKLIDCLRGTISCEENDRECCGPVDGREGNTWKSRCCSCSIEFYRDSLAKSQAECERLKQTIRRCCQCRFENSKQVETCDFHGRGSATEQRDKWKARAEAAEDGRLDDLRRLLRVLGQFDGARPESPTHLFEESLATVKAIVTVLADIDRGHRHEDAVWDVIHLINARHAREAALDKGE